ncbi:unnamed protein product [Candidula unifasciata]|uniref:Ribosomal protein S8 n=1 Tax=Candidula unifasciata TaxID=100452 RepID=A0A8S4A2J3_9EUPU|nr:unnamed protein product [Candidula unifasciata]
MRFKSSSSVQTPVYKSSSDALNSISKAEKCGKRQILLVSPRFDVSVRDLEKWTNNLLPSRQFGFIVMTSSVGIMAHKEARRKHMGGKILGFFF